MVGVATATPAMRATTTIPIVFAPAGDPVRSGLVPSLGSPGGNLTGVSLYASELNEKRLEVFKEAFPNARRVGALRNGNNLAGWAIGTIFVWRQNAYGSIYVPL